MTMVRITSTSAVCPIGTTTEQIWSAARARISRVKYSSFHDSKLRQIKLALLPDDVLGELSGDVDAVPLNGRQRRMLRLALPPLRRCANGIGAVNVPVFLGLPEARTEGPVISNDAWLQGLTQMSEANIDLATSKTFATGRAAAFDALSAALQYLQQGPHRTAIVGGVDTYRDPYRLAELDVEGRLLVDDAMDGFNPGEGAAFVAISNTAGQQGEPATIVRAASMATDPGHRYSAAPAKGEGLADAIEALRSTFSPASPASFILCGLNGEGAGAKEWGVAQLRHVDILSPEAMIEHPADCYGDLGAATGAMLLALAHVALRSSQRQGPALIWASSDREPRGCAWLELQHA